VKPASLLIVDAADAHALASRGAAGKRKSPMPESLVVFDELGAHAGQLIAVSEGREACMPFHPVRVPIDAYNAAILDTLEA
jgi:microcompartment protein CcmK/EutM